MPSSHSPSDRGSGSRPASSPRSAQDSVIARLRCPVCGGALQRAPHELSCAKRHSFNIAKQGYISLLSGYKATSGDDGAMATARDEFLASGAYAPVAAEVADRTAAIVSERRDGRVGQDTTSSPMIVEAGCGTGYYLAAALDRVPDASGFGFDTGVRGLRRAARAHDRALAASWDVYRPFPLTDGCADAVLDVFSPRNPEEFHRVLAPGGGLVVARPADNHLAQLREAVDDMVRIDPAKEDRLHRALDSHFTQGSTSRVEFTFAPTAAQARALVAMTPSARHVAADELERTVMPAEVTVSVLVGSWTRQDS